MAKPKATPFKYAAEYRLIFDRSEISCRKLGRSTTTSAAPVQKTGPRGRNNNRREPNGVCGDNKRHSARGNLRRFRYPTPIPLGQMTPRSCRGSAGLLREATYPRGDERRRY